MKKLFAFIIIAILALSVKAQNPHLPLVQEKLQALKWLAGNWQGNGWMMNQQGVKMPFDQKEIISYRLNNTILHIEGIGTTGDDTVHHALAIVSFDPQAGKYNFTSYTHQGGSQHDALVEVKPTTLIWKMLTPRGSIRYTIVLNEKGQWFEVGEFSSDGEKSWNQFFEMTLDNEGLKLSNTKK
ncbi:hypothetical protein D770_06970 [Flammeovirgaceae bacterium 311]|nr:hypothetical protein D770_06970 [Flammeovirgaceae bacterium 311]